jgi:hypothetical protein
VSRPNQGLFETRSGVTVESEARLLLAENREQVESTPLCLDPMLKPLCLNVGF